jgi:hypothetical protein
VAELSERDRQLIALLRNLSGGFSSYRLFGGDVQQPGFREAITRVKTTATAALSGGRVRVRIHGHEFFTEIGPMPDDEAYRRLALACYERRVEELAIVGVPTTKELVSLYSVLAMTVPEVEEAGGAPRILMAQAVESIRLNEALVGPSDSDEGAEGFTPESDPLIAGLEQLEAVADEITQGRRIGDASSLFNLLREVVAALPPDKASDPDTYKRLREAVEGLPDEVRTSLSSMLESSVGTDDVAERLIGTMTDTGLAHLLVEVSRQVGSDPMELARELVVGGFRRHDLVELASVATHEPGRSLPAGIGGQRTSLLDAVAELVATDVGAHTEEDEISIREEFPSSEEERITEALLTFSDYLRVDDDHERLSTALESWARATRDALKADEMSKATLLVDVADRAFDSIKLQEPQRAQLIADAKATILDQDLVSELTAQGSRGEGGLLLSLFGDAAVDILLQSLAEEDVGAKRSMLIGVVAGLVSEHHDQLREWVNDPRWFVVRNVMTIVQRSGTSAEMLKLIDVGLRHAHPAVRKEASRALGPAGPDAIPRLVALAMDADREVALAAIDGLGSISLIAAPGDVEGIGTIVRTSKDAEVRKRALEILDKHPAESATTVLQSISRFGSKPRAPLKVRRQAKALAARRKRSRP